MGSLITFSDDSARNIYRQLAPEEPQHEYLSSRLLSRQIKYVMHKLHREITLTVLNDLERSLRSRTKDSWGTSFCTLLILCLCIEGLQTATDTMVICDMRERGEGSDYCRNQSVTACEELEEYPFGQPVKLFHDIYKSQREGKVHNSFNPLRMASDRTAIGLDKSTEKMIEATHAVVMNRCRFHPFFRQKEIC